MDTKVLNISKIDRTWPCCAFRYRVFIKSSFLDREKFAYVLETLSKWFGSAVYYWCSEGSYCFLCDKKIK